MEYGNIPGVKKQVSRLVQGALALERGTTEESHALLDQFLAVGCNTFDTAHGYGRGEVDKLLGGWQASRGVREQIVILAKGAHPYDGQNRVTPHHITSDLTDSLGWLQTHYIDLYVLHRDDPAVPVEPIIDVLNEHHQAGRIHAFGASNWSYQRIAEANAYAEANGLVPFVASSVQMSLAEMVEEPWPNCRSIGGPSGAEAREWYRENNIAVMPWSSLAGGFFSGRFRRDNLDTFTEYFDTLCVKSYCYEDNFKRLDRAEALAAQKGLTLPQIAMAYNLNQDLNIFPLVGCRKVEEMEANIEALNTKLTPEEMAWLDLQQDEMPV